VRALHPALLAAGLALLPALAGCSGIDAALSRQAAVVNFKPNTTVSTLLQVRATCSRVPNLPPLALPPTVLRVPSSVRYQASNATAANLAALRTCLERFSAVSGVWIQDTGNKN
jgi:hypothetical protein